MIQVQDKTVIVQTMKALLDELSAPDLTIARSSTLRLELARLMESAASGRPTVPAERTWSPREDRAAVASHPFSEPLLFPTPFSLRSVG